MDGNRAMKTETVMMQWLFALLLSLAAHCDRAASAGSQTKRSLLLSILRRAPAAAFNMVSHHAAGLDLWVDLAPHVVVPQGDSLEDAEQLAHYYRVLAQVLLSLMALLPQPERKPGGRDWLPLDPPLRSEGGGQHEGWWRGRNLALLRARSRGPPLPRAA